MDTIKFEADSAFEEEGEEWLGRVLMKSSGGIERVIHITKELHGSPTTAENAAVVEFAAMLDKLGS